MGEKIKKIIAREVLDSKGNPTIEVDVYTNHCFGREMVPSGTSKGKYEALELRDKNKRYFRLGVKKAVNNVNTIIAKKLIGKDVTNQSDIDNLMIKLDGTKNKSRLGANAILGTSLACARAAASCHNMQMFEYVANISNNKKFVIPVPFMNVINGGLHAGNDLAFQEYIIVPIAKNFSESLRIGSEVYHHLSNVIQKKYGKNSINLGDEGGYAPLLSKVREPLKLIRKAVIDLGYENEVRIAIDAAASHFYRKIKGKMEYCIDNTCFPLDYLYKFYQQLTEEYPIIALEDPFDEDHFDHFAKFNNDYNPGVAVIGDDLLATNIERIKKAINLNSCNVLLLKLNQIGTLTEAINAGKYAIENHWDVIISHRSGETETSFISDLAVGLGFGQIKAGAPNRGERTSKYNQLLRIEEYLGKKALYPKKPCLYSCSVF